MNQKLCSNLLDLSKNKNIEESNNIGINMMKKSASLYASVLDAKRVLAVHKSKLSDKSFKSSDFITPLESSNVLPMLFYKREDLTCIKAYKVRGALYQMQKLVEQNPEVNLKFVAASTGNHALGVLKAAEILKVPDVVICVSKSVTAFKREKLERKISKLRVDGVNAQLVVYGDDFDETNEFAKSIAKSNEFCFYIDPYNNKGAVAGQGTVGLEILGQLNEKLLGNKKLKELTVIAPVGGGGLLSGVSCAIQTGLKNYPALRDLKLKMVGVALKDMDSEYGDAIKVKTVGDENIEYLNYVLDKKFYVDDFDMKSAMDFVLKDINARVEGASAATLTPLIDNLVGCGESRAVVCVLSGGNVLGL